MSFKSGAVPAGTVLLLDRSEIFRKGLYSLSRFPYNLKVDAQSRYTDRIIQLALDEDRVCNDITTRSLRSFDRIVSGEVIAREPGFISGTRVFQMVFTRLDPRVDVKILAGDGEEVSAGQRVVELRGMESILLRAERTALNFLQRLSGVATLTAAFVRQTVGLSVQVLDTRKTTPGMRYLQKEAVLHGGGSNHRMNLEDLALVKDNHIRMAGSISRAVAEIREQHPGCPMEVETRNLEELREALSCGVDWIMLDNYPASELDRAIRMKPEGVKYEVSGNVTLDNIREKARPGIDCISVGALTHSYRSLDLSMEIKG